MKWLLNPFPETDALVGTAALASAVMQAPLTSIPILFEMTKDYTIVLPSMVCCIVATYTMRRFTKNSIYVQSLLNRGINIQHGKATSILSAMSARDVMTQEVVTIPEEMPFKKILEIVSYSRHLYYPVVDRGGDMVGIISFWIFVTPPKKKIWKKPLSPATSPPPMW